MATKRKSTKVAKSKNDGVRILKVRKGATMREIYAAYRKQFTAADLQKYTEIDDCIPFEPVIAELEQIHRQESRKPLKKDSFENANSKRHTSSKDGRMALRRSKPMATKRKSTKVSKPKNDGVRILKVRKGATMREILAAARKAFTADDLQKYTEIEEGVPAEEVLAQMEKIQERHERKSK